MSSRPYIEMKLDCLECDIRMDASNMNIVAKIVLGADEIFFGGNKVNKIVLGFADQEMILYNVYVHPVEGSNMHNDYLLTQEFRFHPEKVEFTWKKIKFYPQE